MRIPQHRRRSDGRGVVTVNGTDHYTGEHGSAEAEREYRRVIGEHLATGSVTPRPGSRAAAKASGPTVAELVERYAEYVAGRFRKRGEPTSFARKVGRVVREVAASYGDVAVRDFGPVALMAIREGWVRSRDGQPSRMTRDSANDATRIVVRMFQWAVAREMTPSSVWHALEALEPLTSRDGCREPVAVHSADLEDVEATCRELGDIPRAIVRLILATGMRPSEACSPRACDIDRSASPWTYRVQDDYNKVTHTGKAKIVYLGPQAQAILQPWLDAAPTPRSYLFRPGPTSSRKGNVPYLASTLEDLIDSACVRGGIERWNPYDLRHSALTRIYAAMGMKYAQAAGGHSVARTTLGYIDEDVASSEEREAARKAAMELG